MNLGVTIRFGLGLLTGVGLIVAAGCASTAGWGPAPPNTGAGVSAQQGAPRNVQTTGMKMTAAQAAAVPPPWVRVQDCAIVAVSTPTRYSCPDGKVYTSFALARARNPQVASLSPPPPLNVVIPPAPASAEASEKIVLRGAHFDLDKADIRPQDAAVLDEAAETLKAHPNVSISVDGYCDSIGSVPYNKRLSEQRADAVVNYLTGKGIAPSRLTAQGYGKTDFVASNRTEEGRAQNRRVELSPGSSERVFLMGVPGR